MKALSRNQLLSIAGGTDVAAEMNKFIDEHKPAEKQGTMAWISSCVPSMAQVGNFAYGVAQVAVAGLIVNKITK